MVMVQVASSSRSSFAGPVRCETCGMLTSHDPNEDAQEFEYCSCDATMAVMPYDSLNDLPDGWVCVRCQLPSRDCAGRCAAAAVALPDDDLAIGCLSKRARFRELEIQDLDELEDQELDELDELIHESLMLPLSSWSGSSGVPGSHPILPAPKRSRIEPPMAPMAPLRPPMLVMQDTQFRRTRQLHCVIT